MKKQLGKLIFFRFLVDRLKLFLVLVFLFILVTSLQFSLEKVKASNLNYTEDFTTTSFKNAVQTSANWLGTGFVDLNKSFVRADGSRGYIDDVSADQDVSSYPLIFLDNKQQPYIAWENTPSGLNSDIFFSKGNLLTLNWEQMSGIVSRDNVSHTVGSSNIDRVAVASDGNPFVVWQDNTLPGPDGIYGNGDDIQGTANDYSILFSQWNTSTNTWSKMDGSPGIEKISNNAVGSPSRLPRIVLDSLDRPFIVWDQQISPTNNEIYFTRWDGTKWAKMDGTSGLDNLSNNLGESSFPRIMLDTNNRPQVMWQDDTSGNKDIFFIKWSIGVGSGVCGFSDPPANTIPINNCWTNMAGTTASNENISNNAGDSGYDRQYDYNFQIGTNNFPYIAWRDNTVGGIYNIFLSHWNGTAWSSMDSSTGYDVLATGFVAIRPQLVLDTNNNPQLVWLAGGDLYFSHWNPGTMQWEKLDGTSGNQVVDATSNTFPTLAIDAVNNLYISWLRGGINKIVSAVRSTGSNWTKLDGTVGFDNVSGTTPWTNNRPQMVLAPNGNLFFAWETGVATTNSEIWATYWDNDLLTFRIISEGKEQSGDFVGENHWDASPTLITTDSADNAFLLWEDACKVGATTADVCLTHWDGTKWSMMDGTSGTDQISNSGGGFLMGETLKFDSTKTKPYLAWLQDANPVTLLFERWNGTSFVAMDGSGSGPESVVTLNSPNHFSVGSGNMMALDSADSPYLVISGNTLPATNEDVYFGKWTIGAPICLPAAACWTNMAGDTAGFENISNEALISYNPVIFLDSANNPLVSWITYLGSGNGDITFSKWTPGSLLCANPVGCWTNMAGTVAGPEKINTLASSQYNFKLDSAGVPYFLWMEGTTVYLTHWNGSAWSQMDGTAGRDTIVIGGTLSRNNLNFDSANNPYIIWDANHDIYFTRWDGTKFATMSGAAGSENVSNTGKGQSPSIVVDSLNNPAVIWSDRTEITALASDYFFKHWDGSAWVNMRGENSYTNISRNVSSMGSTQYNVAIDSNDDLHIQWNRQDPGVVNLYYSRTGIPINYYRTAQSLDISGGVANVSQATLSSVADNNGGPVTIKYFFSNDGGYLWQPVTVGVPINFISNTSLAWRARMKTTNTLVIPTITGLSVDYMTASGPPTFGGNPAAPSDLSCTALSNESISWNFTDNANNETGFKLRANNAVISEVNAIDQSSIVESGLQTNSQYIDRQVTAFNNGGESDLSNKASCYTLANKPAKIEVHSVAKDTVDLDIEQTDGNPANTVYAIRENNSGKYVQADGTFGENAVWQTEAGWGGENAVKVVGGQTNTNSNVNAQLTISLAENTAYSFSAKAKNGDGVETAFSDPVEVTTGQVPVTAPLLVATKGVAINLVKNGNHLVNNIIKTAQAQSGVVKPAIGESHLALVLRNLGIFLALALFILFILLISGLLAATRHLAKGANLGTKLKLAWHILSQQPAKVFSAYAAKESNGTYGHAYEKHRSLHVFAQKNFKRLLGLAVIDIMILSYVAISLNHNGAAQTVPYDQSGVEVSVGDKLSYIIELENQGTGEATGIVVTDTLNADLAYVAGSAKININGMDIADGITVTGQSLSFSFEELEPNLHGYITFDAKVGVGSEDKTITNQAQISGSNFTTLATNTTSNHVKKPVIPVNNNGNTNVPPGNTNVPPENTNVPPENVNVPPENVNVPPENINVPPVTPPVIPVIGSLMKNETVQAIAQFFTSRETKQTSQNVVTPILLGLAAINTLPTAIILTSYLLPYLNLLFIEPLLLFFRKKRKKWGIVYDSLTKLPVGLALVRLYSQKDNRLVQTKVTDKEGRYIMIVNEPGSYYLSVTKPGYEYPSRYLHDEKQDAKYIDLYHGEPLSVKEQGVVVTANIPLDPVDKKAVSASEAVRSYLLGNLRLIISYLGITLALIVVLIYPTAITIGSLLIHVIFFALFRKLIVPPKPKSWGIVYDEKNKQPLHYALVRILDTKFNKLLETQVTDSRGRYSFLVGKNEYQLLAEKAGYQAREIKPVDLVNKETIVDLDVGLKKAARSG